jgi:hypothetical protein
VLVGYIQLTTVLVVGYWVFHVPVRGPLLALYGASLLFIVASLGLGLFVSTLGRNQAQVMQTAFLFLLPNILLSGFMWPREAMPAAARYVGIFLPLTHYLQVVRGIVLKGNGLTELWPQLLALAAFALAFFLFSTCGSRRRWNSGAASAAPWVPGAKCGSCDVTKCSPAPPAAERVAPDPYRVLFPVGVAAALAGLVPWILVAARVPIAYPGPRTRRSWRKASSWRSCAASCSPRCRRSRTARAARRPSWAR